MRLVSKYWGDGPFIFPLHYTFFWHSNGVSCWFCLGRRPGALTHSCSVTPLTLDSWKQARGKARALNSCHIGVCSREEVILDLEGLIVVTFDVKSLSNPRLLAILNWCLSPEARRRVSHQNPLGMRHDIFS